MASIRELLARLTQTVDAPDSQRAEHLWATYRAGGPDAEPAFATLMAWYGGLIYRRVRGFVRSDGADDVFQEVVVRLHRHRHRLSDFGHALRWARAVAMNLSLRALRTERRRQARERVRAITATTATLEGPDELLDVVRAAVAQLPAKEREAVALAFFEGLTRQAAAEAIGVHRDTLARRIESALRRLRAALPAAVLAAGGSVAVEGALAISVSPSDRLSSLIAIAWEQAGMAGTVCPSVRWWVGGLTVALGLVVGGAVLWPQPGPPPAVEPPLPQESLQAKNLRILKDDVLPKVLAELQRIAPPDNTVSAVETRAFGSEVVVEFRLARPVPWLFDSRMQVRYCVLARTGWAQAFDDHDGVWRNFRLPSGPVRIPLPLGGAFDLPRHGGDHQAMMRLFDALPRDERAEQEQVTYWFGPGGWSGDEFTVSAGNRGVAGNSQALFVTTLHGQTFVRRATGGWKHWGDCEGWNLAADDTRLYYTAGSTIRSLQIEDPSAAPATVAATPLDLPLRSMTVGDGCLFVALEDGSRLCTRPLSSPAEGWTKFVRPDPAPRLATDGRRLFAFDNHRLQVRKLEPADSPWELLGPAPEGIKHLVVWGDRLLGVPKYPGPIYARPTAAGAEVGWEEFGRVVAPPDDGTR